MLESKIQNHILDNGNSFHRSLEESTGALKLLSECTKKKQKESRRTHTNTHLHTHTRMHTKVGKTTTIII